MISLVGLKACLYHLLKLYRVDPRIPKVYALHLQNYENHPLITNVHLIGGILFILLMGLQFSKTIRKKSQRIHNLLGSLFILSSFLLIFSGFYIGIYFPFAGISEQIPMLLFSLIFIFYLYKALFNLFKKEFKLHSIWMLRSSALALSVATQRILVTSFSILKIGEHREMFVFSIYLSIIINIIISEIYLKLSKKNEN